MRRKKLLIRTLTCSMMSLILLTVSACQNLLPKSTTTGSQASTTMTTSAATEPSSTIAVTTSETTTTSTSAPTSTTAQASTETTTAAGTTSGSIANPSSSSTAQKPELKITLEKIEENFVVLEGEEVIDEFSGSYYDQAQIDTNNPELKQALEEALAVEMKNILTYWERFTNEKEEALANAGRVSVVLHHTMEMTEEAKILSLFSTFRYGGWRSEYSPAEYFAINIDTQDGHIISLDELMLRLNLKPADLAKKANEVLKTQGISTTSAMVKPGDINKNTLFYNGKTLQLLVIVQDPNFGKLNQLLDLGEPR